MSHNKKSSDELNYKQAYLYLFQQVTDIIKKLKTIQRKAEEICIDETLSDNTKMESTEII